MIATSFRVTPAEKTLTTSHRKHDYLLLKLEFLKNSGVLHIKCLFMFLLDNGQYRSSTFTFGFKINWLCSSFNWGNISDIQDES